MQEIIGPKIIGIAGLAGAGKDTIGRMIIEGLKAQGSYAHRFAFADKLKEQVAAILNIDVVNLHEHEFKRDFGVSKNTLKVETINQLTLRNEPHWTIRQFLQLYGTEAMQGTFGKNIWVNMVMSEIKFWDGEYAIITDVRFKHEYDAIKERGGKLIHVYNTYSKKYDLHSSETEFRDFEFDYQIENDWKNKPEKVEEDIYGLLQQIKG